MNDPPYRCRARTVALVLLFVATAASAAQAPGASRPAATTAAEQEEEVLDEVVVSGERPSRSPTGIAVWLRRLLGRFSVEGYVDVGGKGNPEDKLPVRGAVDCAEFGYMPAVSCDLSINWPATRGLDGTEIPGGVSTLAPAMILYAFEVDWIALRYMLVDSRGTAEVGRDYLRGNTFSATSDCVGIPGDCKRVMRVNARPDGKLVQMQIDIMRDSRLALRYLFVMHKVGGTPGTSATGAPPR